MNKKRLQHLLGSLAFVLPITACTNDDLPQDANGMAATAVSQPASGAIKVGDTISGKVLESADAGTYTYVHLDLGGSETWIAVAKADVATGADVSVLVNMVMADFHSKTLERDFDEVIFATELMVDGKPVVAAQPMTAMAAPPKTAPPANPHTQQMAAQPTGTFSSIVVEKASGENAYSIGEIFENKAKLAGKPVTVRGKVLKVTANVMGVNWIHMQDGTGDPTKNTHDLVVTSASIPETNQVVTVEGILATDKNLGAGYIYSVLIEQASFSE